MKLILSIISAISILVLFGPYSAFSYSDGIDNMETKYGNYIDGYISKLESKTDMLRNTKSEKLRKQALLDCLKINFLKTNKEDLTKTLSAYRVGMHSYRIQYTLNGLFFNSVKRTMKTDSFYSCLKCGREINLKAM
jgi:hypothetical protein